MPKVKYPSIKALKKTAWDTFSRYIRLRDCLKTTGSTVEGRCYTCSRVYPFRELQAGHLVGGRHNAGLFSEKGVHAQCFNCNITLRGNTLEYRRRIVAEYGGGADIELENEAKQTKKFTVEELQALTIYYTQKITEVSDA